MEKYLFSIKCLQVWTNKIGMLSDKSFQSPTVTMELVFHSGREITNELL